MIRTVARNFKPSKKGLGKILGPLEQEIMEVLWSTGGATGKEVMGVIRESREIAMTTVFTVLDRLTKKGLVTKTRGESFYVFTPAFTREEFSKEVSHEVLSGVLDLWSGSLVNYFVDILAEKDPSELDRLSRIISMKKSELEKGVDS